VPIGLTAGLAARGSQYLIGSRDGSPGRGLYGGSKIAPQFLVEVLAKEIGIEASG